MRTDAANSQVMVERRLRQEPGIVTRRAAHGLALLCCLLCCLMAGSYAQAQAAEPVAVATAAILDRVVADVDGQAILASDVDDDMRFSALQPGFEPPSDNTPQRALNRVIDRTLIDQQRALQPGVAVVSQKDVDQAIAEMRKQISTTSKVNCETDAGWRAFLAQHGFTPAEVEDRMRERLAILKFIDLRFGVVVQISQADVRNYYEQVLVPELKKDKAPVPQLNTVARQIREVLRQQQVSSLIDEWLKSLRAEGHIQILDPAYAEGDQSTNSNGEGGQ
ncbi:MAG: SurA N-terminal domain-containing protein [Acidobacteriaceae bacterium]